MVASSDPPKTIDFRGVLNISLAVVLFACADALAKYLGKFSPVPLLVWARYFAQLVGMVLVFAPKLGFDLVRTQNIRIQVARGVLLLATTVLFFAALKLMPLADASAIAFAAPMMVVALSSTILSECVGAKSWGGVIVGFAGVLVVLRPGFNSISPAMLLPVGSAFSYALYQILTRKLAGHENILVMLFLPTLIGTLLSTLALPLSFQVPTLSGGFALARLGFLGGAAHFVLTKAFRTTPASRLSHLLYTQS